ncbi:trace amine-associated receptor 365-like [Petromyzon marinus]|uniref:Trace amine-associated receptor 1853.TAAR349B n=1 Tax=Petromyzon marinus TaxID=7757 RepID=A0A678XLS0_PETMA|nr:trace amine-associated receptor 9-like [Petromyzon marinus]AZK36075.1 trace amine-associated receptor 1853.TAAR349B [Petromyzon marinus]
MTYTSSNNTTGHCVESFENLICSKPKLSDKDRIAAMAVLSFLISATIFGNCLIITTIAFFRQLQTNTNTLALSLAVSDLLVGAIVMPFSASRSIHQCWFHGRTFCRVHYYLDYTFCNASILCLGCIAFDRHVAICDPLRYAQRVTRGTLASMLALIWVGAALLSAPTLVSLDEAWARGLMEIAGCPDGCHFAVHVGLTLVVGILPYFIIMLLMLLVYGRIYGVARRQSRQINNSSGSRASDADSRSKWVAMRREHSATLTLGMIVGFYLVSWLPYFTASVLEMAFGVTASALVWATVIWFGYANSVVNPILYATFNRPFRTAFRIIFSSELFAPGARDADLHGLKVTGG